MSMLLIERGRFFRGAEWSSCCVHCSHYFASIYIDSVYVVDVVHKAHKETDETTWNYMKLLFFHLGLLWPFCHSVSCQYGSGNQIFWLAVARSVWDATLPQVNEGYPKRIKKSRLNARHSIARFWPWELRFVVLGCRFLWLVPRHPNWRTEVSSHIRSSYTFAAFSSCSVWSHLVWVQYGHLCFAEVEDAQFEVHALTASWEAHTLKAWHLCHAIFEAASLLNVLRHIFTKGFTVLQVSTPSNWHLSICRSAIRHTTSQ